MSGQAPITVYDIYRAVNAGKGATITTPTDGGKPWTLREFMWTERGIVLVTLREGEIRDLHTYLDLRGAVV